MTIYSKIKRFISGLLLCKIFSVTSQKDFYSFIIRNYLRSLKDPNQSKFDTFKIKHKHSFFQIHVPTTNHIQTECVWGGGGTIGNLITIFQTSFKGITRVETFDTDPE